MGEGKGVWLCKIKSLTFGGNEDQDDEDQEKNNNDTFMNHEELEDQDKTDPLDQIFFNPSLGFSFNKCELTRKL